MPEGFRQIDAAGRAAVLAKARELVAARVPFAHGQASRHGLDCVGLLRVIGTELGYFDGTIANPAVRPFIGYGRQPNPEKMRAALDAFCDPIDKATAQAASIVWFKDGEDPRHLGILTESGGIIHATLTEGRVVEHDLPARTRTRYVVDRARIAAAWDFRLPGPA